MCLLKCKIFCAYILCLSVKTDGICKMQLPVEYLVSTEVSPFYTHILLSSFGYSYM